MRAGPRPGPRADLSTSRVGRLDSLFDSIKTHPSSGWSREKRLGPRRFRLILGSTGMAKWHGFVKKFWHEEVAATMLEYVIIIGFVASLCVVTVGSLGVTVLGLFQKAINGFP
jgi:Flp pilus assembly pilin Flp